MYYYLFYKEGRVCGWLASKSTLSLPWAKEVTLEEYQAGGGRDRPSQKLVPQSDPKPSVEDPYAEMAKAIREGVNEV